MNERYIADSRESRLVLPKSHRQLVPNFLPQNHVSFAGAVALRDVVDVDNNQVKSLFLSVQTHGGTTPNICRCQCYTTNLDRKVQLIQLPRDRLNLVLLVNERYNLKLCFQDKTEWRNYSVG